MHVNLWLYIKLEWLIWRCNYTFIYLYILHTHIYNQKSLDFSAIIIIMISLVYNTKSIIHIILHMRKLELNACKIY